jgi:hypothetical protein
MKTNRFILSLLFYQVQGFTISTSKELWHVGNSIGPKFIAQSPPGQRNLSLQLKNDPDLSSKDTVTTKNKLEVCLYRLALTSASVAYATSQASKVLLVSGSGLSSETIASMEVNSHAILGWGILLSALFAPPYLGAITDEKKENDVENALFLLLNELLPTLASFAIVVEIINTIQQNLSQNTANFLSATSDTLDSTTNLFICAICLREIGFFGVSYKAEAVLAIFFCVALTLNDSIGFSEPALTAGTAISLLVLSFGKVFEPIEDDLRPNKSAFFKDDRLL